MATTRSAMPVALVGYPSAVNGDTIIIDTQGAAFSTLSFYDDNVAANAGNLVIRYGNGDSITVEDHFAGTGKSIELINFNGGSFAGFNFGTGSYSIANLDNGDNRDPSQTPTIVVGAKDSPNLNLFGFSTGSVLFGGDKFDQLIAGPGSNLLVGGGGSDNFVFRGDMGEGDIIADFQDGIDTIDLAGIFGQTNFQNLSISYDAATNFTTVYSNNPDFPDYPLSFKLFGEHHLTVDDFIFIPTTVTFTGTSGNDTIDANTGEIVGFTGGRTARLFDSYSDIYVPGGGDDTIILGPNGGRIDLYSASDISAGDVFVGGSGNNDIIHIHNIRSIDFRPISITGFDYILTDDQGPNSVTMSIDQYNQLQGIALASLDPNEIFVDIGGKTAPQTFALLPQWASSYRLGALHIIADGSGNEKLTLTDDQLFLSIFGQQVAFDIDLGAGNADEVRIDVSSTTTNFDASQYESMFRNVEILTIAGGSGSLRGTSRADTLIGSDNYFTLYGGGGNDTLTANGNYGSLSAGTATIRFTPMAFPTRLWEGPATIRFMETEPRLSGWVRNDGHDTVIGSSTGTDTLGFADYDAAPGTMITTIDVARTANGYHVTYGNSSVDYVGGTANLVDGDRLDLPQQPFRPRYSGRHGQRPVRPDMDTR